LEFKSQTQFKQSLKTQGELDFSIVFLLGSEGYLSVKFSIVFIFIGVAISFLATASKARYKKREQPTLSVLPSKEIGSPSIANWTSASFFMLCSENTFQSCKANTTKTAHLLCVFQRNIWRKSA